MRWDESLSSFHSDDTLTATRWLPVYGDTLKNAPVRYADGRGCSGAPPPVPRLLPSPVPQAPPCQTTGLRCSARGGIPALPVRSKLAKDREGFQVPNNQGAGSANKA